MSNYYPYLMANLPFLQFGTKPPFPSGQLIDICSGFVAEADMERIKTAFAPIDADYDTGQPTLRAWHDFEIVLRNELVRLRAPKRHADPMKYLREDGHVSPYALHVAFQASKATSLVESEKLLDEERWRMLEDMEVGHYFDVDRIIIYAYRLFLLEKWHNINTADKKKLLSAVLH
ncbi:MAG: DUF2764 family protein [Candidatus Omnitrophota bacterium]